MVALGETTSATRLNGKDRRSSISVQSYSSIPGTVLGQEPQSRQATGVATRVLQRDPIGYRGGINLYGYVMGNSVGSTDPNGQQGQGSSQYIWHGPGTAAPPNSTLPCNDCPPGQQSTTYWQANGYQSTNACIGDVGLSALIGWGVGAVGQGTGSGGNVGGVIGWAIWAMLRWIEYTAWITCISQVCH